MSTNNNSLKIPTFEPPYNVKAAKITPESVLLTWTHSNPVDSHPHSYKVEYKQVENDHMFETDIKDLYRDGEDILGTINNLTPNCYEFRVKVVYSGIAILCSSWSQPLSTIEEISRVESKLRLLVSANNYKLLHSVLDVSHLEQFVMNENIRDHCQVGCIYDMSGDKPITKLQIYPKIITQTTIPKKLHLKHEVSDSGMARLFLTYQECAENLQSFDPSRQQTISDTIYVHYISSQIKGFRTEIKFTFQSVTDKAEINRLIRCLCKDGGGEGDATIPAVTFSVTGKLPTDHKIQKRRLKLADTVLIRKFFVESFYESIGDYFTLSIGVLPLNLEFYYSPIFEKLFSLRETLRHSLAAHPPFGDIADSIHSNVTRKIQTVSELIKSGGYYLPGNQFLKDLNDSILLSTSAFRELHKELSDQVVAQFRALNSRNATEINWGFNMRAIVTLSLKSVLHNVKRRIQEMFCTSGEEVMKMTFTEFVDSLPQIVQTEIEKLQAKMDEKERQMRSTSGMKLFFHFHSSWVEEESSLVTELRQRGKVMEPQPPVFVAPENITVKKSATDTISINWEISQPEVQQLATSFKVNFRQLHNNNYEKTNWQSVVIHNEDEGDLSLSVTLRDFSCCGEYEFNIQAIYGSITGVCSESNTVINMDELQAMNPTLKCPPRKIEQIYQFQGETAASVKIIDLFNETVNEMRNIERSTESFHCFHLNEASLCDLYHRESGRTLPFHCDVPTNYSQHQFHREILFDVSEECDDSRVWKRFFWRKYFRGSEVKESCLPDVTVSDSRVTYLVSAIDWGNYLQMTLSTQRGNTPHLEEISDLIIDIFNFPCSTEGHERELLFVNSSIPVHLKIESNLPGLESGENVIVNEDTLSHLLSLKLGKLMSQERCVTPLYLRVTPVNLETYFKHLLDNLHSLINSFSQLGEDSTLSSVTHCILVEVMSVMRRSVTLLRDQQHGDSPLASLHEICHSHLLQFTRIEQFVTQLHQFRGDLLHSCEDKLLPTSSCDPQSPPLEVRVRLSLAGFSLVEIRSKLMQIIDGAPPRGDVSIDYLDRMRREMEANVQQQIDNVLLLRQSNLEKIPSIRFVVEEATEEVQEMELNLFLNGIPLKEKLPLLEAPSGLRQIQSTEDSITVAWQSVIYGDPYVRSYRLDYRIESQTAWQTVFSSNSEPFVTVLGLSKCHLYRFRVQAVYDHISSLYSKESGPLSTRRIRIEEMLTEVTPDESRSNPPVYDLPLTIASMDSINKTRICYWEKYKKNSANHRTILMLGSPGCGKRTVINGLVNFICNVNYSDNFRLKLIPDKTSPESEWISLYHLPKSPLLNFSLNILDIPNVSDPADHNLIGRLDHFLATEKISLTAVCLVIPNSTQQLVTTNRYLCQSLLPQLPHTNLWALLTFSDSSHQSVLSALDGAGVNVQRHFSFNNCALYGRGDSDSVHFNRLFWNIGCDGYDRFLTSLAQYNF